MFLGRVARRLRAGGPAGLWYAVADRVEDWRDARFDRRLGIDTSTEPGHQPIQIAVFDRIVRALPRSPRELAFADFGCGKGRALVLAAEHGFARVAGVEIVATLHARALANIRAYRDGQASSPPLEATLGDAAAWNPPSGAAVLFFYNPFDEAVWRRVVAHLRERWLSSRPEWFVAYRTALHARALVGADWLESIVDRSDFRIWRAVSR